MLDKILIECHSYKEAFKLRKLLIDLNISWWGQDFSDKKNDLRVLEKWHKLYKIYGKNTVYNINKNQLLFSENKFFFNDEWETYSKYKIFKTVNDFFRYGIEQNINSLPNV